jgi:hypothetical protein
MATGTEILSYRGDPNLGVGANADIPVNSTKDLDLINQTSRDIYLNGVNRNQQMFQQKIRDRDALLSEIDSGKIKVGDLLEQDAPIVKEGLEKLDEAFENRIKKGINDIDAARAYKKALRDAQDRVTQAQGRKIFYDGEGGEIGKETLPRKQEARKKNLDNVINGGFWKDIQPYQQTQDLDIAGSILSTAANITTEFTDPKTYTKGKRTVFDYEKTLQNNVDNFLNDVNKRYDQDQLLREIQELDAPTFTQSVQSINNQIAEHNKAKGLAPGAKGYVEPVKFTVENGKGMIAEKAPDFAAKYTLAHQKPLASTETQFDKERAAFDINKRKLGIAQQNADANTKRANTYSAIQQKKLSQMDNDEKQGNKIWSGLTDRITTYPKGDGNDIIWAKDVPAGYTYIGGLDKEGKPIKLKPKKKGSVEFYETKYKGSDGQDLEKNFLKGKFDAYKGGGGKGDYKAYVKELIKNGVVNLEIAGENGTADFETAFQTQRAINNKLSSKGEEPVFGMEETTEVNVDE